MNKDINNINNELQTIKNNLKEISNTITEQFSDLINSLRNNNINSNDIKNSENKEISLNKALIKDNINDFSFKAYEEKIESPYKLKNKVNNNENLNEINSANLNLKPIINEQHKKNVQINFKNNEDSLNSIIKEDIIENNESNNKIINILSGLESKLDLIDNYTKDLPNLINDKLDNNL